jgi:predicted DCC family thiol-disulfide oxidoreductase YuxK
MKTATRSPEGKILIEFDGFCVLCSRTVGFLLKADRRRKFVFRTLSPEGEQLVCESVIVTDGAAEYRYFDAVMKIGRELGGFYRLIVVFRVIPASWRRRLYLWVAKNRFRWFGKRRVCYRPAPAEKERFL